MAVIIIIWSVTLVSAVLSAILGMGGGVLLMGTLVVLLPVPAAMIFHGSTQLIANLFRALLLREHIQWRLVAQFASGVLVGFAAFLGVQPEGGATTVLITLGLAALIGPRLPSCWTPRIERKGSAPLAGLLSTIANLLAGAAGPFNDMFYVRSHLNRYQIVATKSLAQAITHVTKIVYFGLLARHAVLSESVVLPLGLGGALLCALIGTWAGKRVLTLLDEARFRALSGHMLTALAALFLLRALW